MIFVNWIVGPHLIGLIFILAGMIQKHYPPKEINSLYGYRTKRSMKDQQNWDEGNKYSTQLLFKCGLVLFITGIIITAGMAFLPISPELRTLIKVIIMLLGAVGTVIVLFTATEKHLKRTFPDTL
ncbi:MAG: SdpI family protein [Bacteroidota bacterium]